MVRLEKISLSECMITHHLNMIITILSYTMQYKQACNRDVYMS